ncbi:MAG: biopolymer transporter ExbD [Deltaproteobacteria bacterium]|nr:biopolymer transporter ExbD [Deltaproteobacteria bacterium]
MFDQSMGRRSRQANKVPQLNLNSMMDMLSIILVFLLANISADEKDFVLAADLTLPLSTSKLGFIKAVQVKLTTKELMVEDQFVAKVSGDKIVGTRIEGKKIVQLYNMLQRYRSFSKEAAKDIVILQADREFPFELLDKVLRTAAMAGYPNFRLAIQKE